MSNALSLVLFGGVWVIFVLFHFYFVVVIVVHGPKVKSPFNPLGLTPMSYSRHHAASPRRDVRGGSHRLEAL